MSKNKSIFWKILVVVGVAVYLVGITIVFVTNKVQRIQQKKTPTSEPNPSVTQPKSVTSAVKVAKEPSQSKEALLKQSLEQKPDNPEKQQELASLYYQQGQQEKAIEQYKKILQANPNDVETHLDIAQIYMTRKEWKPMAVEHLQKVLQIQPQHPKNKIIGFWIRQNSK